jgi:hypothetical protein
VLEVGKQIVGTSSISENEYQDIVEGSAPSEMKEETTNSSLRAMEVGTLTTLGTFALTDV